MRYTFQLVCLARRALFYLESAPTACKSGCQRGGVQVCWASIGEATVAPDIYDLSCKTGLQTAPTSSLQAAPETLLSFPGLVNAICSKP